MPRTAILRDEHVVVLLLLLLLPAVVELDVVVAVDRVLLQCLGGAAATVVPDLCFRGSERVSFANDGVSTIGRFAVGLRRGKGVTTEAVAAAPLDCFDLFRGEVLAVVVVVVVVVVVDGKKLSS